MTHLTEQKIAASIAALQKVSRLALVAYSKLRRNQLIMPTNEELHYKSIIKEFSDGKITINQAEQLADALVGMTEGIKRVHSIIRRECGQNMESLHLENERLKLELSTIQHKQKRRDNSKS